MIHPDRPQNVDRRTVTGEFRELYHLLAERPRYIVYGFLGGVASANLIEGSLPHKISFAGVMSFGFLGAISGGVTGLVRHGPEVDSEHVYLYKGMEILPDELAPSLTELETMMEEGEEPAE